MKPTKTLIMLALATIINSGCGGGGGGSSTTASPNGIYSGNITGGETASNGTEEKGIIYNNRLMVLSKQTSGTSQMFDANLTVADLALSGTGSRYDDIQFLNSVSYSGTYINEQSTSISFSKTSGAAALPDGTMPLIYSSALFSKGSANSKLAGTWTGLYSSNLSIQMSLSLDANGTITSGADQAPADCLFTGTITTADTSVNAYNVTITSDGGTSGLTCGLVAGTYTGLAWTEGDTDGTLILMMANATLNRNRAVILTKN